MNTCAYAHILIDILEKNLFYLYVNLIYFEFTQPALAGTVQYIMY